MSFFPKGLSFRAKTSFIAHLFKALTRRYHHEMAALLAPILPKDAVIFDVGAHSGQMAKLLARLSPHGRIFAFEPSPYALRILILVKKLLRLKGVEIIAKALGPTPGESQLVTPLKDGGTLGFGLAHVGKDGGARKSRIDKIEIIVGDDFVRQKALTRLDLIKIDVEGHEFAALSGLSETLDRLQPNLVVEIVQKHLQRAGASSEVLWQFLLQKGYRLYRLLPGGLEKGGPDKDADYLCLSPRQARLSIEPA